ncbi:MAG: hypothetical protein ACREMW_11215 [Gemmatimonadales bacterium]
MKTAKLRGIGYLTMVGGAFAFALAPSMVAIKYMTGWAIIPEPFWVSAVKAWFAGAFMTATPAVLWMAFGTGYSIALLLVFCGLVALAPDLKGRTSVQRASYWLVVGGLALVLPGDAIHSWTWHQNGLTIPTPGSNPTANTAYAAHMMGMNFLMVGSLLLGITALRRRTLVRWLAWMFALVFPAALLASLTLLPTTPSGALWLFSVLMGLCGYQVARGRRLLPPNKAMTLAAGPTDG